MAQAQSLPLLSQYSDVFTRLHEGRLQCVHCGMNRVLLNRYIVDSAESTTPLDPAELLSMVDPEKVEGDGAADEKLLQCKDQLRELISLQEEVNTLQKVAREKGITGGFLNIVGQASIQSPADHGASVIHQLSALMGGSESADNSSVPVEPGTTGQSEAANDEGKETLCVEEDVGLMIRLREMVLSNWQMIGVDVLVCFFASLFAIGLVS